MTSSEFFRMRSLIDEDDPYPAIRHFRENDPVHRAKGNHGWFLFRHADVLELLHDERFSSEQGWPDTSKVPEILRPMMEMRPLWMLNRDAPEHTRLRTPLARTFTPQRVAALVPRFEALADSVMDTCLGHNDFDAIQDYALPFVRLAMAELSGIPNDERQRFSRLVSEQEAITSTREAIERNAVAVAELGELYNALLQERRDRPEEDLISAIAALGPETLSWKERIASCVLVISAGAGVTVGAIGNSLAALLNWPEEGERFRREEVDLGEAVDELMRFDPTAPALIRIAKRDGDAFGVRIAQGEKVTAILGGANRDPAVFADPERLDLARRPVNHLAFGHGIHFCIGASLAKAQVRVALQRLLTRAPVLRRTSDPIRWRGGLQRVLASLPVSLEERT